MPERIRSLPAVFDPIELEAASAAFCGQFGDVSAEAYRRATLRELLDRAHTLAQALQTYMQHARMHYRGSHCTADLQAEATALSCALHAWSDSVDRAANACRDWQERRALLGLQAQDHVALSVLLPSLPNPAMTPSAPMSVAISDIDGRRGSSQQS